MNTKLYSLLDQHIVPGTLAALVVVMKRNDGAEFVVNRDRGEVGGEFAFNAVRGDTFATEAEARARANELWTDGRDRARLRYFQQNGAPAPADGLPPAGRYAVEMDGQLRFFHVDRPTEGRWAGYVFVSQQAGDDLYPVKNPHGRARVLLAISVDPEAAARRYGRELGVCGVCGRTLTNAESRAAGIGPVCAGRF